MTEKKKSGSGKRIAPDQISDQVLGQVSDQTSSIKKARPKKKVENLIDTEPAESVMSDKLNIASHPDFPVVGIGASAGGLAAFEAFFSGMPTDIDSNMAFVLVQHLDPDHKSILTSLIQRYTRMQVFEVEDGMVVQPNCAYIIPPGHDMAFLNGSLHLLEPSAPRGKRMPIDFFFRSLAQDQHARAICIVLSGTGSDGTLGVRAIKAEGGMVMAQAPESTPYDGMPRSALATGLVDYELSPFEMPAQLINYVKAYRKFPMPVMVKDSNIENSLKKIFILLRTKTGHDFSLYKPNTLRRRIERRMAVHQIEMLDNYVKCLQQMPVEIDALFRDLLIGVTSFFRDADAFKALEEQVIPSLFANKPYASLIRVWVPGCSTGEEAYSIAILMLECMEKLKRSCMVQIFATDIDSRAIATARSGRYPVSIAADISPERLGRYFISEPDGSGYRIHKALRDMLVFSEQDVIKDPPFSKLNLISCRNLLIYMGGDLQSKLIPLFHYALNPGGFLFLGTSETVGEYGDLFKALDRKLKLYERVENTHGLYRESVGRFLPPMTAIDAAIPRIAGKMSFPIKQSLRELTEQTLLQHIALAGVLVNRRGDILYLHGRTGLYFELAEGIAGVSNILKMAREGLRYDLAIALHKAAEINEIVLRPDLRVKTNGSFASVNLTVRPVALDIGASAENAMFLVILEQQSLLASSSQPQIADGLPGEKRTEASDSIFTEAHIASLMQDLRAKEEYLQTANEELETSNEELKSSNEEMQSIHEELQSTNEELETSKEELQSVNEELTTVNTELQSKLEDLSKLNNDMNNLLSGTGIAIVFVDHCLHILRFTPTVTKVINLIQSDIGRPVGHIVSKLKDYKSLEADVQIVLDTLIPKESQVQTVTDSWYMMRILPYRTIDNVIEGAVITFVDITEMKLMKDSLMVSEMRYRRLFETAKHGILMLDADTGRIINVNPFLINMLGYSQEQFLGKEIWDIGLLKDIVANKENFLELQNKEYIRYENLPIETADGRRIDVEFISNVYLLDHHKVVQCDIRDIRECKRDE